MSDDKKKYVNTSGKAFFGKGQAGADKALSTNMSNEFLTLGIHNPLPKNEQKNSVYDYRNGSMVFLTVKKALLLSKLIKKCAVAIDAGETFDRSFSTGSNLVKVCSGGVFETTAATVTLVIFNDLNENKVPGTFDVFQFEGDMTIDKFDVTEAGGATYDVGEIDLDVDYFADFLYDFALSMANGSVHATNRILKFNFDRITMKAVEIGEKLGIEDSYGKNKNYGGGQSWGGSSKSNTGSTKSMSSSDMDAKVADLIGDL